MMHLETTETITKPVKKVVPKKKSKFLSFMFKAVMAFSVGFVVGGFYALTIGV